MIPSGYDIHSLPWKNTMLLSSVNHLFLWAMASMAMLNNQRVYIYIWWLIPLSKWVITLAISGLTLLIPFITGVIYIYMYLYTSLSPLYHRICLTRVEATFSQIFQLNCMRFSKVEAPAPIKLIKILLFMEIFMVLETTQLVFHVVCQQFHKPSPSHHHV